MPLPSVARQKLIFIGPQHRLHNVLASCGLDFRHLVVLDAEEDASKFTHVLVSAVPLRSMWVASLRMQYRSIPMSMEAGTLSILVTLLFVNVVTSVQIRERLDVFPLPLLRYHVDQSLASNFMLEFKRVSISFRNRY